MFETTNQLLVVGDSKKKKTLNIYGILWKFNG